jgi:hypothetical protein
MNIHSDFTIPAFGCHVTLCFDVLLFYAEQQVLGACYIPFCQTRMKDKPTILTEDFCGFPQPLQAKPGCLQLGTMVSFHILSNSLFNIILSSTLQTLIYYQRR